MSEGGRRVRGEGYGYCTFKFFSTLCFFEVRNSEFDFFFLIMGMVWCESMEEVIWVNDFYAVFSVGMRGVVKFIGFHCVHLSVFFGSRYILLSFGSTRFLAFLVRLVNVRMVSYCRSSTVCVLQSVGILGFTAF